MGSIRKALSDFIQKKSNSSLGTLCTASVLKVHHPLSRVEPLSLLQIRGQVRRSKPVQSIAPPLHSRFRLGALLLLAIGQGAPGATPARHAETSHKASGVQGGERHIPRGVLLHFPAPCFFNHQISLATKTDRILAPCGFAWAAWQVLGTANKAARSRLWLARSTNSCCHVI